MKTRLPAGFTITELLVSMAILLGVLGLSIAGLRPFRTDVDVRLGAQQLATALIASQSRSVKDVIRTALTAVPDAVSGPGSEFARMVYDADRHPPIQGIVVALQQADDADASLATLRTTNDGFDAIKNGYRIQFYRTQDDGTQGPPSAWFAFTCTDAAAGEGLVRLRTEHGQTPAATVWPTVPEAGSGQTLSFRLARFPNSFEGGETLPAGVVIDLRYSGYGDPTLTDWGSLAGKGAIAVGFDETGSVDALMQNVLPEDNPLRTVQPFTPCEPIYFFVTATGGPLEAAATNPLASSRAFWVVLHPRGSRVTISDNVPQVENDAAAVRAAREKARKSIPPGAPAATPGA